jgi:hypothetical protein
MDCDTTGFITTNSFINVGGLPSIRDGLRQSLTDNFNAILAGRRPPFNKRWIATYDFFVTGNRITVGGLPSIRDGLRLSPVWSIIILCPVGGLPSIRDGLRLIAKNSCHFFYLVGGLPSIRDGLRLHLNGGQKQPFASEASLQ